MAEHLTALPGFPDAESAAQAIGDLRYDALRDLLHALAEKLSLDASADKERGRPLLASELRHASRAVFTASLCITEAWSISAPHMEPPES